MGNGMARFLNLPNSSGTNLTPKADPNDAYDTEQRSQPRRWGHMINEIFNRIRANDGELTVIRLANRRLGIDGAKELFDCVKYNFHVTSIDVARNNLHAEGASHVIRCVYENEHIQELDLSDNPLGSSGIRALVEPILHNAALTKLILSNVGIGNSECDPLTDILHFNHSLTELDLSNNHIGRSGAAALGSALPYTFTLNRLCLMNNDILDDGIISISKGMVNNRSLLNLDVSQNGIESAGLRAFLLQLAENEIPLEIFNLGDNKLEGDGVGTLLEFLDTALPNLHSLGLRNVDMGDEGCVLIEANLCGNNITAASHLRCLDVSENGFSSRGMANICQALKDRPSIKYLDITCNSIGEEGGRILLETIKEHEGLTTLYYGSTAIPPEIAKEVHEAILANRKTLGMSLLWEGRKGKSRERIGAPTIKIDEEALRAELKKMRRTTAVRLACRRVSGGIVKGIATALASSKVSRVEMMCNNLGPEEAFVLCAGLSKAGCCSHLDLTSNLLGPDGAHHLARFLETSRTLTALYIGGNAIGDEGAMRLFSVLCNCPAPLKQLSLEWNQISKASSAMLTCAFRASTTISTLFLCGNEIGNEGVEALCDALIVNPTLTHADLSLCGMGDIGALRLAGTLRGLPSITVDLARNPISKASRTVLQSTNAAGDKRPTGCIKL